MLKDGVSTQEFSMKKTLLEQLKERLALEKLSKSATTEILGVLLSEVQRDAKLPAAPTPEEVLNTLSRNASVCRKTLLQLNDVDMSTPGLHNYKDYLKNQLTLIEEYLPAFMSPERIKEILFREFTVETLDLGKVMFYFKTNYPGRYDGKLLSTIVKNYIENRR